MALTQTYAPILWECDGSRRAFSVTWQFFEPSDLVITHVSGSGIETLLERGDYKVVGGVNGLGIASVGHIETATTYDAGSQIRIERATKLTQPEAFANGQFPAKRVERGLDRLAMVIEEALQGRRTGEEIRVTADGAQTIQTNVATAAPRVDTSDLERQFAALQANVLDLMRRVPVMQMPAAQAIPAIPAKPESPAIETRDQAIAYAYDELEKQAAARRSRYATSSKELVYLQKQNEARAAIDDPKPDGTHPHPETGEHITKYPHLEAMIGLWVTDTGDKAQDIYAAAMFTLGRAADFKIASAKIERAVDMTKQRIAKATTIQGVLDALASTSWGD